MTGSRGTGLERGAGPETAWLFSGALGTTPEFWIDLEAAHDLAISWRARPVRRLGKTG